MSKSRKILDEIGDQYSSETIKSIRSIDRLERKLAAANAELEELKTPPEDTPASPEVSQ